VEKKQEQPKDDKINLFDYFIVLAKHKKLIIYFTTACAVISAGLSLLMSDIFIPQAKILPPQSASSISSQIMSQFLGGAGSTVSGLLGTTTPADLYVGMLNSRTIFDKVIDKFDLSNLYKGAIQKYLNLEMTRLDVRDELHDNVTIEADPKSSIITISVEDKDPKRAAEMANAFVDYLVDLSNGLAITDAAQRRLFFDTKLKETKKSLSAAEDDLKAYQEKTGVLQVDDQAKAVIEGLGVIKAQIAAKEVEIKVMKTFSTGRNPDLQKAEEALSSMKAELHKLEANEGSGSDPLMPIGRMPSVGLEYARKLRDVKLYSTLFDLLVKQYEMAKLDEAKTISSIQIIDRAVPPDKKAKPKRSVIVILATFTGFFLAVLRAYYLEFKEKMLADSGSRERYETFRKYLSFKKPVQ
jgi:tyrosine-protein kinase Etk/Wzc